MCYMVLHIMIYKNDKKYMVVYPKNLIIESAINL